MIRTFFKAVILVPIGVLLMLFALANRQWTSVSLDPFSSEPPALAIHLPLFLIILLTLMLGVIVGGVAAWFRQRKWRRAARRLDAELREARAEAEAWKHRTEAEQSAAAALTPLTYRPPPAA
jgi:uncharacterized integral membrane protein